ncbi:PAS domain S-box protein [Sediminibacterium roseum]|uniref:histidine kinase n=1 Tax=Sediminibacterium roseum TaxID=1978412 RepID=A0ABW9ZYX2_9BACT|nr:PAS domain-containing sensor histidine kinase [Sediminibacterium roseum]NCI50195.1 PAS domain S-box protein [Sediminibacterium roseum]
MKHLQQFEALFNHATIGIILCNKDAEIINFNAQAETQFGYKKEELVGKKIEVLLPQKYRGSHVQDRNRFYAHPENKVMGHGRDLHGQKKDGAEFPVEVSLSHYRDEDNIYAIAFVIDITVRKNNEIAVNRHREELQEITRQVTLLNSDLEQKVENRTKMLRETLAELEKSKKEVTEALEKEKELGDLKSGFVTMASHEFRTPLSTILSSAFLLSKYNGPDDEDKREKHINRIKDAVNDMKSILEDFLSLGKLEDGLVKAKTADFSAAEYREELQHTIEGMMQIAKQGQRIAFSHEGESDIRVDISLLKNIIINLCSNAIKFSPANGNIEVRSLNNGPMLTVSVKDNGIGISEEDQQHLFERFFRAKNAVNIQGTGLGLHIISKYAELLNASISLRSELGNGTEFTISIPQNEKDLTG